jgi:hypothetical protein
MNRNGEDDGEDKAAAGPTWNAWTQFSLATGRARGMRVMRGIARRYPPGRSKHFPLKYVDNYIGIY